MTENRIKQIEENAIAAYLDDTSASGNIQVFSRLESTNTEAKRQLAVGIEDLSVIIAREQTAGRGRMGRAFYSPENKGIYMTIIYKPAPDINDIMKVTAAAAVAVLEAIEEITGAELKIKWVNDILLNNKKICGILTEAITDLKSGKIQAVIVGIGVNCTTIFDDKLKAIAGSLLTEGAKEADINHITAKIISNMYKLREMLKSDECMEKYRQKSLVIGKQVKILQEDNQYYLVKGIGDSAEIILKCRDGTERILTGGEISIRLD